MANQKYAFLLLFLLLATLLVVPGPAEAGGDVAVCDEAHLLAALAGGGTVTFSCSGTIVLSDAISISLPTVIDGSGENVTISGDDLLNVFNVNASTTLQNLTIVDGYGGAYTVGGAIDNGATLIIEDSTIASSFAAAGGAIYNSGTLTVTGSTFIANRASGTTIAYGGAIYLDSGSSATIANSTFAGNSAGAGGALWNGGGTLNLYNVTFGDNAADSGSGNAIYHSGGTTTLTNTIVKGAGGGTDCIGSFSDGGGNVSYPDGSCPGLQTNPLLGPLQDNGGPTNTMALGEGSPALDHGIGTLCAAAPVNGVDQRGVERSTGATCDSGAYEAAGPPMPDFGLSVAPTEQTVCAGVEAPFDVTLTSEDGFDEPVTLSSEGYPAGATASFSENPVVPPATVAMDVANTGSAAPGDYTMAITGMSPTHTHTISAVLTLLPPAPDSGPSLLAPADMATGVVLTPTFSWDAVTAAEAYTLTVANDANFTDVVYTAVTSDTSHTAESPRAPDTEYFWRVTPANGCGAGPASETFSFTTMAAAGGEIRLLLPLVAAGDG